MPGLKDVTRADWRISTPSPGQIQATDLRTGVKVRRKSVCKTRSASAYEPCIFLNSSLLLYAHAMGLNALLHATVSSAMGTRQDLLLTVECPECNGRRSWSMASAHTSTVDFLSKSLASGTAAGISTRWRMEVVYDGKTCAGRGWPVLDIPAASQISRRLSSGGATAETLTALLSLPIIQQPWNIALRQLATSQKSF